MSFLTPTVCVCDPMMCTQPFLYLLLLFPFKIHFDAFSGWTGISRELISGLNSGQFLPLGGEKMNISMIDL